MYSSFQDAKEDKKTSGALCPNHYMTIIGLNKYYNEKTADYEYILKVSSWGRVYYIRYDEYGDSLNAFGNIFKIS